MPSRGVIVPGFHQTCGETATSGGHIQIHGYIALYGGSNVRAKLEQTGLWGKLRWRCIAVLNGVICGAVSKQQ